MLDDAETKTRYELDNNEKASPFEGKQVKVTGTLDSTKKLIHVEQIEATA